LLNILAHLLIALGSIVAGLYLLARAKRRIYQQIERDSLYWRRVPTDRRR
jgi:hypothetical protein